MKKLNLFALFAMGVAIALCSCANDSTGGNDGGQTDTDEYGYFSLSFADGSSLGTRAPGDLVKEYGEANESEISSLRVLLYNASGTLEYTFDYDMNLSSSNLTGEITSGSTNPPESYVDDGIVPNTNYGEANPYTKIEAEYIKLQAYKLLVIVNPTIEIKAATATATASEVKNLKVTDLFATSPYPDYSYFMGTSEDPGILMTNFQEFVDVEATDLKPSKSVAETNPVIVHVDRAVAKVVFAAEDDLLSNVVVPNDGAAISDLAWKLDITNKDSYVMRHMTYDNSGTTMESTNPLWSLPNRHKLYANDVNMDGISFEKYDWNQMPPPSPIDEDYAKDFFNYIDKDAVINAFQSTAKEYAFENTMNADEQYEDVTTAAILKLKYSVTRTALYDAASGDVTPAMKDITAGDPYFVWTKGANTVAPTRFIFNAAGLKFIRDLNTSHAVFLAYPDLVELHNFLVADQTILEGNAYFGSDYGRSSYTASVQHTNGSNKLAYHHDLMSYYRVLIRHYDDVLQPIAMAWGRYGIVRNNVYKLTLKSVDGPGDIDIPDPKGPDDKYAYLSVQIDVLPWLVRAQDVNIR